MRETSTTKAYKHRFSVAFSRNWERLIEGNGYETPKFLCKWLLFVLLALTVHKTRYLVTQYLETGQ